MKKGGKGTPRDPVLREFEGKDLGDDIRAGGAGRMIYPKRRRVPTSILLDEGIVDKLRAKAERRGISYLTMMKIIVHEHVDDY